VAGFSRSQPIRTGRGWFVMYHGFETRESVDVYRTFWALLDLEDPSHILRREDEQPGARGEP
jgi:beta-1,2-mannobiose phosphorylase / 1,2-beta-oligomannan phosphorylase